MASKNNTDKQAGSSDAAVNEKYEALSALSSVTGLATETIMSYILNQDSFTYLLGGVSFLAAPSASSSDSSYVLFLLGSLGFTLSSMTQLFIEMSKGCALDERSYILVAKFAASFMYLIGSSIMKAAISSQQYHSGISIFIAGSFLTLSIETYCFRKVLKSGLSLSSDPAARVELYRVITSVASVIGAILYLVGAFNLSDQAASSNDKTFKAPSPSNSETKTLLISGGSSYTSSGVANVAKNETIKLLQEPVRVKPSYPRGLSRNPNAIHILENKPAYINWSMLSENPNAVPLLERNLHKVDWRALSGNPSPAAITLLEKYKARIDWSKLSGNPSAMSLLEANLSRIDWAALSRNTNPTAVAMLESAPIRINWSALSANESEAAVKLLEQNLSRVDWSALSGNSKAIALLEQYPRRINWDKLSANAGAISLLERYPHKINWSYLSSNPSAIPFLEQKPFKIDWARLSENPSAIHLLEDSMHKIVWGNEKGAARAGYDNV